MTLVFLGIACVYFGWSLAGCAISATDYIKVRKEVALWQKEQAGRR